MKCGWAREASGERDFRANTERMCGSLREENSHRERQLWDKPWPVRGKRASPVCQEGRKQWGEWKEMRWEKYWKARWNNVL